MLEKNKQKKIDYKWVIVALSFLMVCVSLGFCSSTKSLFLSPVTKYLNIERGVYSINDSCRYVATAVINLFFGSMIIKFGPKKLILAGMLSLITAMLIYAYANNVFVFYIGGVFLGIGFAWTSTTMVGYVINEWCKENKGTIMGAVLASNGLGGAIAMQFVSPIIEKSAQGYKSAYILIAIILVALLVLLAIFFKDKSKVVENGLETKGQTRPSTAKKKRGQEWVGLEWNIVVKKWWFYLAVCCIFFTGFVLQGITGISAAHMKDVGIEAGYVATVLSVHSICLAFSKFLTGFIYDKFGLRITTSFCTTIAIVTMFVLSLVTNSSAGMVLAMTYSILSALALPLETIILPIYASDLFGQKDYGKVLGIIVSANVAGYALGAPAVNLVYDLLNSYNIALYICAAIMILVLIVLQLVFSAAKKEKIKILEQEEK